MLFTGAVFWDRRSLLGTAGNPESSTVGHLVYRCCWLAPLFYSSLASVSDVLHPGDAWRLLNKDRLLSPVVPPRASATLLLLNQTVCSRTNRLDGGSSRVAAGLHTFPHPTFPSPPPLTSPRAMKQYLLPLQLKLWQSVTCWSGWCCWSKGTSISSPAPLCTTSQGGRATHISQQTSRPSASDFVFVSLISLRGNVTYSLF